MLMATANNGQVVLIWGDNENNEPAIAGGLEGFNVKQVVCAVGTAENGFVRAYILTEEGRVFQWGPSSDWKSVPHKSRQITSGSLIEKPVTQIASCYDHFAAVTKDGDLYTWGDGESGVLGHGGEQSIDHPKLVEALNGIHVIQVTCLSWNTAALSQDGKVYMFGANSSGCNGNGRNKGNQLLPTQIEDLPPIKSIAAFSLHVAAVCHQGHAYTWGYGEHGKLGLGDKATQRTPTKVEALSHERIVQVSCGVHHTAALTSDGTVYSFGHGGDGKLGHNNCEDISAPKLVESLRDTVIRQVSCGFHHTCFLSESGELYMCGNGKLGHGLDETVSVPRKLESLCHYTLKSVNSFGNHTVAFAMRKAVTPDATPICVSLRNMVNTKESADIVFQIGDDKVYAHKVFLVERSEFFQKMLGSGMRESSNQMIPLSDINKSTLLLVLEYLYTGNVVVPEAAVVDLYMAAEMYGLAALKQTCKESLRDCLTVENAAEMLVVTCGACAEELSEVCLNFAVENFKSVSETAAMSQVADNAFLSLKVMRAVAVHHCE